MLQNRQGAHRRRILLESRQGSAEYIPEWITKAPWPTSQQVEQGLIISRALCDLFNAPALAGTSSFRTARKGGKTPILT
jgi:hypothetical protein